MWPNAKPNMSCTRYGSSPHEHTFMFDRKVLPEPECIECLCALSEDMYAEDIDVIHG